MKKQTAVEWLFEKFYGSETFNHDEVLEEAKSMEMDQICKAYVYGSAYGIDAANNLKPEIYYKEAYKSE